MYSSARAESLTFSWIVGTRSIMRGGVADQRLRPPMPIEASVRSGLTNRGMPQVAAGLQVGVGEDGEVGVEDLSKARTFLASPLSCRR